MITDVEKAQWILENGNYKNAWIFERVDDKVYKRPIPQDGKKLPPWLSKERVLIKDKDGKYD
jgi:hypothetical protein|tara:strand:+ start:1642 stop:1827 length:186 start_codon:yes stop_codon:yes gene_type:complete